jgi:hypothetical protein
MQQGWAVEPLRAIFLDAIRDGERTRVTDAGYLRVLGWEGATGCTAGELWAHLVESAVPENPVYSPVLDAIRSHGPLARRMLRALGTSPERGTFNRIYRELCECLAGNRLYVP